jgi:hypothetical protein
LKPFDEGLYRRKLIAAEQRVQEETQQASLRVEAEVRQRGNLAGLYPALIDSAFEVLRKYLDEADRVWRETWLSDNDAVTPASIRASLVPHVSSIIAGRAGAIGAELELQSKRTGTRVNLTPALGRLKRIAGELQADLTNRYEIEAIELEKRGARGQPASRAQNIPTTIDLTPSPEPLRKWPPRILPNLAPRAIQRIDLVIREADQHFTERLTGLPQSDPTVHDRQLELLLFDWASEVYCEFLDEASHALRHGTWTLDHFSSYAGLFISDVGQGAFLKFRALAVSAENRVEWKAQVFAHSELVYAVLNSVRNSQKGAELTSSAKAYLSPRSDDSDGRLREIAEILKGIASNLPGLETNANQPGPSQGQNSDRGKLNKGAAAWQEIEITFLSDHRVEIFCGDTDRRTYNYGDLGFQDRRSGKNQAPKPTRAWVLLCELAKLNGTLPRPPAGKSRAMIQKRIEEIREKLQGHFGTEADPIPFNGTAYQTSFKISCGPSFDT